MFNPRSFFSTLSIAFALLCAFTACGGGGSGSGGGGGIGMPPTTSPSAPLTASGNLQIVNAPLANGFVVYSCGCSAQAGTSGTDAGGNFTMPASAPATPSAPNPTYTLGPDRNYMIVGTRKGTPGTAAEAWTMEFVAQHAANNLSLNATNSSDVYTAAGALYVYYLTKPNGSGDLAFDQWNFNQIATWVAQLKTAPSATEQKLINDIIAAQSASKSLYPAAPTWNKTQQGINYGIATDIQRVRDQMPADPALPTPCPSGCTGTPAP